MSTDGKDIIGFLDETIEGNTESREYEMTWGALASFLNDYEHLKGTRGLTQKDIAASCGTTQSAISRLERMRGKPTYELLRRLSEAVGGSLFVSPMADFSITLPYDLHDRARSLAEKKAVRVDELMHAMLREAIDNAEYRDECNGTKFELVICGSESEIPVGQYAHDVLTGGTIVDEAPSAFSLGA